MDKEELNQIIASRDFTPLIGKVENDFFDCKKEPYQLSEDSAKRELAKDVSSFANVNGGFVLIGIKTKPSPLHFGDEVESIHPFPQKLVNTTQYRDILRAWVYPEVDNIDISWIETDQIKHVGIVVIQIPCQKETAKPFLVSKVIEGKKQVETMFGYSQRKGDTNQPLMIIDIQKSLRAGLSYENDIRERLDGIEFLLRGAAQQKVEEIQKKSSQELVEQRISTALEYESLESGRNVSITAYPVGVAQLRTIFLSGEGSIKKRLENPPILRYGGWNLRTLDQAKIIRGEMIRVGNGKRIVVDLYRDGTMIFAGQGDHRFLSWHDEGKQKINPVALIEIIYEYLLFYHSVLKDCEQVPEKFTIRFDLKNLHKDGIKTGLAPYHLDSIAQMFERERKDAPDNQMMVEKTFSVEEYNVARYTYLLVREVYLWFGLEEDKIPYTKEDEGIKIIDLSTIRGI